MVESAYKTPQFLIPRQVYCIFPCLGTKLLYLKSIVIHLAFDYNKLKLRCRCHALQTYNLRAAACAPFPDKRLPRIQVSSFGISRLL